MFQLSLWEGPRESPTSSTSSNYDVICDINFLWSFTECPGDSWGLGCNMTCNCLNGGKCNKKTGECECASGYVGPICENSKRS